MNQFTLPTVHDGAPTPWTTVERSDSQTDSFSFAVLSDRTGGARPGVFERAIELTNQLRPDFTIQVGDCIEGYTNDPVILKEQWAEFDTITDRLESPLFRVPGNHDISNEMMRDEWLTRHGMLYYHFRRGDVLFCVLDTQDPVHVHHQYYTGILTAGTGATTLEEYASDGPVRASLNSGVGRPRTQHAITRELWNGTMPIAISDEQAEYFRQVLADHADARWTVLSMHMPAWQGAVVDNYRTIVGALGDRNYTAFAGHVHNYRHQEIDGQQHIRLGPTGGAVVLDGEGNADRITVVNVGPGDPRITSFRLDTTTTVHVDA